MENFYLFVIMSAMLILLPGPDTAIVTKNTLAGGSTKGIQTLLGTICALLIHTLAAVAGLSAIIVKSAVLFSFFKYAGALYLVYLGVKSILSLRKSSLTEELSQDNKYKNKSYFKQGFLTNILNPKVAVFFLTFLPQFVNTGSEPLVPFLLMGITYAVLTAGWFLLYIFLINQISTFMKKPNTTKVIEALTGTVLIGFGIKLAFEKVQH
ncbi:LysE family translocator [Bacillus sp. SG-1]|uniref:LysE family translocator n=1 Tax=Bacillus sp. SG-1 TaxID=161544 RepID=UPI000154481E|nr:LysE family translocator [Bacillus sp. SG-1]EDL62778.1 Transporter, LysE family protein [Bacillus sp. SG-1]